MQIGSLVRYRERDWVVLASDDPNQICLRPIGGSVRETCRVYLPLSTLLGYTFEHEHIKTSQFPLPEPHAAQDHAAVRLLIESARLLLREGAAPFRSLGHVSVRPRPYQFVPLVMALRLDTARLLIADDVGVGKTIEAGLIARELLERGEIRRVVVLCPPYLCDQWQKELAEKFHIDAVVVRSGTVARLERQAAPKGIFEYYPHLVVSIDLAKSERYKSAFLHYCPNFVIVDEAHGAAQPRGQARASHQQQRHELLKELAQDPARHLILLTATPHSGVEESFRSIIGLLKPKFRNYDLAQLNESERQELARHFVQRRRGDVREWLGADTHLPFPERKKEEKPYAFSKEAREFYNDVYNFARGLVRSAETLKGWQRRMRFWSALALLRCVASSPAAAEVALSKRARGEVESRETEGLTEDTLDEAFAPVVYDPLETESVEDAPPSSVFDLQEQDSTFGDNDRRRLRDLARRASTLRGDADTKLIQAATTTEELLRAGFHPIIWCRYIATADYVADELRARLTGRLDDLRVASVTGALSDEERRVQVEELGKAKRRVLVATDCLSEGINLQEHFNAVVHYDLPWNPNRLEQREGRVDRFGQIAPKVKAVLIFGQDNPVDGAVLEVLLRKAHEIYHRLGVYVPVPMDSESVMEAVLRSLFARASDAAVLGPQLRLFDLDEESKRLVDQVHQEWERAEERERASRTRFAQHAIKLDEVQRELTETDRVLGSPDDVRRFLQEASQRLNFSFTALKDGTWELDTLALPPAVRQRLGWKRADGASPQRWRVMFHSPTPAGVTFLGRNHLLVEALAEHLLDLAMHPPVRTTTESRSYDPAARCGVIRTTQVARRTTLLLLRARYLVYERKDDQPALAEETLTWGFEGLPPNITPLSLDVAQQLLDHAHATANVAEAEKREVLAETLEMVRGSEAWQAANDHDASRQLTIRHSLFPIHQLLDERKEILTEAHQRVRQLLGQRRVRIEPQSPPDLLGVLVLLPVPKG